MIYFLGNGRQPGYKAIEAIMSAFPDLPYERLFVSSDSSTVAQETTSVQRDAEVTA